MSEVVDVETAGCHVGSHEELRQMAAELLHREVALLLREVAVECLGIVAVVDELVGNLLGLPLCAAEDDAVDFRVEVDYALQGEILVLGVDEIVYVVHVFGTLVARSHHNLLIVMEIAFGHRLDLLAHRCREEQCVVVVGHAGENLRYRVLESHVQHLVGLVEHHVVHVLEFSLSALHEVDESSRCSCDDLCAVAQRPYLLLDAGAAVDSGDVHVGNILRELLEVVADLQAQLAGRTQDDGLSLVARRVDALKEWNAEGGCLSRSCLRQGYDVVAITQEIGDYFFLYWHWLFEAKLFNGLSDWLRNT